MVLGKKHSNKDNLQLCMAQQREESWVGRGLRPAEFPDSAFPVLSYAAHCGLHGSCCYREKRNLYITKEREKLNALY